MCVTNTAYRRQQPITFGAPKSTEKNKQNPEISGLTQRLLGTFELKAPAKPQEYHQVVAAAAAALSSGAGYATDQNHPGATFTGAGMTHVKPIGSSVTLSKDNGKSRPKRRRKPQKPGKTAKMNDRHFVVHNYHDHSTDSEDSSFYQEVEEEDDSVRRKGGVAVPFPLKLHAILDQVEQDGLAHVISWQPHGRCFCIHDPKYFVDTVMPK